MTQPKRKRPPETAEPPVDPIGVLARLLVPALLIARLLIPAEASVLGDTLGLVLLWFAAVVLWAWSCFRTGSFAVRLGWLDAALWLLIAGHAISTGWVFVIGGDRRAAVNMLWEWIALGVSFLLIRQTMTARLDAQRLLLVMSAMAVAMAGQGIWQHYVTFPENVARYERLRALEAGSPGSPEVQRQLAEMEVPEAPASRILWEERLRSTEPFATMALANTLAGLLAAWLVVIVAAVTCDSAAGGRGRIEAAIAALVVAFCLVLTKSRTAVVGACAGLAAWGGLAFRGSQRRGKWIVALLAGIAVVGVLLFVALWSGGLDWQVLSESPKSLRYRLQYWRGAIAVIREQPFFGTGPGNFRQHYLRHKLPESSEEILDPHNFLLDVWTSAGLIGVLALVWLVILAARMSARAASPLSGESPPMPAGRPALWTPMTVGAGLGFALVLAAHALFGGVDEQLLGVPAVWLVALAGMQRRFLAATLPASAAATAALALMVHLLGAGGFEMPAVAQTLLVLLAAGSVLGNSSATLTGSPHRWLIAAIGLTAAVFFVLTLLTAAAPVLQSRSLVAAGDLALSEGRNPQRAERLYSEAAEWDRLSPEPVERLAELAFSRWARSTGAGESEFERGANYGEAAIRRDPFSANGYRRLGVRYLERYRRTGRGESAQAAVRYLTEAVERYPHAALLRAERARAFAAAGDPDAARDEAVAALGLEAINRQEGHRDKYLPADILDVIREIGRAASDAPIDRVRAVPVE